MEYIVTMAVTGRYIVKVEANDLDEARKFAEEEFSDADFGELSEIDGYAFCAEDENGDLHDLPTYR